MSCNTKLIAVGSLAATVALVIGACTEDGAGSAAPSSFRSPTIEQPDVAGLSTAPEHQRVDVAVPTFSAPTEVTNPLFPVARQKSVLLLGTVDGKEFRTEVTLLPETRIIEWQGQRVETRVSQYAAFLDGRIHEIAYDLYAQADDGSVWYFGEDVFNFADGSIADTHGTWIAGRDGPAAMIMPAKPKVGDVYRPENIPGFVFEEVTVKSVGDTLDGPLGEIHGGLLIEELHMDGTTEDKSFAPGYGEFYTSGGGDTEALALAVPEDAAAGSVPATLATLSSGATDLSQLRSQRWKKTAAKVERMSTAWASYSRGDVPNRIEPVLSADLEALARAVEASDAGRTRAAAVDVAQGSLDLQLRHRPVIEVDLARFELWLTQLVLDAEAGDAAAVNGDFFTLDYIRDRILPAIGDADATRINSQLEELNGAVSDGELGAAATAAAQLRESMAAI